MRTDKFNVGRPAYYTVRQAAWILGVEPSTISRAIRLGTLCAVRRHGRLVIPERALTRLLAEPTGNDPQTGERTVMTSDVEQLTGGCSESACDNDTPDYAAMAAWLDWLQDIPTKVLTTNVVLGGLCLLELWPPAEPDWEACASSDRTLAERLCEGCPVIDQCLELELRTAGASTTGVWGALAEDDRRALHGVWRQRRQHPNQDQDDQEGAMR